MKLKERGGGVIAGPVMPMYRLLRCSIPFVALVYAGLSGVHTVHAASPAHAHSGTAMVAEIDVDRSADHETFASVRTAITTCQPATVHLHYAFGSVVMTTHRHDHGCRVQITIEGELAEERKPESLFCDVSVMHMIDWLKNAGNTRETPPRSEVQALSVCHRE